MNAWLRWCGAALMLALLAVAAHASCCSSVEDCKGATERGESPTTGIAGALAGAAVGAARRKRRRARGSRGNAPVTPPQLKDPETPPEESNRCRELAAQHARVCAEVSGRSSSDLVTALAQAEAQFTVIATTAFQARQEVERGIESWRDAEYRRTTGVPVRAGRVGLGLGIGWAVIGGMEKAALSALYGVLSGVFLGMSAESATQSTADIRQAIALLTAELTRIDAWQETQLRAQTMIRDIRRRELEEYEAATAALRARLTEVENQYRAAGCGEIRCAALEQFR